MAGKTWTEEELSYLRAHGPNTTCAKIAKVLGRTVKAVTHKYNQLNLSKNIVEVGDIVKGWKILHIYVKNFDYQNITTNYGFW